MIETAAPETREKRGLIYEVGYHLSPVLPEENVPAEVGEVKAFLEERGASFVAEEFPRRVGLAYALRPAKARDPLLSTYFGWVKFELDPGEVGAVREFFKKRPSVVRFLLARTVRESTLAPRKLVAAREGERPKAAPKAAKPSMTDEELDRTLEELTKE